MEVRSRLECKKGKSKNQCKLEFLQAHQEFELVEVIGDGNCFFRSIAAYYERHPELSIDGVDDPTDHNELRQYIIEQFELQIMNDPELSEVYIPALNERSVQEILNELATNCIYDVPVFEMMVERTAPILNINLRLFRMNKEKIDPTKELTKNNTKLTITEAFYPSRIPVPTTISILLVFGHYELLYPNGNAHGMPALAAHKKSSSKTQKKSSLNNAAFAKQLQINNNAEFAKKLQNMSIGNSPSKKKLSSLNKATAQNRVPYESITVDAMKILLGNYSLLPKIPENTTEKKRLYRTFIQAIVDNTISIEEAEKARNPKSKKGGTLKKKNKHR
jgi:hypothetical protein